MSIKPITEVSKKQSFSLLREQQAANSRLNDAEFESRKTILTSSPKVFFLQAAGPCDSQCVFCSRGRDYEFFDLETHRSRFEEKLNRFLSKAEQIVLTGSGEYLLLPEAEKILDYFEHDFPHVEKVFSTNGSGLTRNICDKIANGKSRYTMHISLHSSNSNLHKVLTRTHNFDKILDQLRYLVKIRVNTGNPTLRLIFVATTLNIEDLPDFVRLAADLGVDKVVCYYNYIYVPVQKYLSCFFKQALTNKMLDEAERIAGKSGIPIDLPPRFGLKNYNANTGGICREPWSQIMLDSQGHILPCDAAEDANESMEGKGFMYAWNSLYYQDLRMTLIEGRRSCFRHCFRANPDSVNDFCSHVIHRGKKEKEIDILWGDDF